MIKDLCIAMLWSISPFGEAKVGIPYGMLKDVNVYLVFVACVAANILVFPLMLFFLEYVNRHLLRWNFYKKSALFIARRAKTGSADKIQKYGFWGLMFFVMIPLPGTGVYAGSIATYILKMEKSKAFWANLIGIIISSLIVWVTTLISMKAY
ncbi:COG2426 family protein [Spongiimicrobium salis]|uniref:COG2426 family protein n=1 Tax=Spongiimicrobium salis TaxID=1667022 RepID=UPI00374D53FD